MTLFTRASAAAAFWERSPLLASARDISADLDTEERRATVEQMTVLLRDFYVHLPLKRSSLGIDPVQELVVLHDEVQYVASDRDFFRRIGAIVGSLRDRHTLFRLPYPYSAIVAYLPFTLETVFVDGRRQLIVSKLMFDLGVPGFVQGAEVTHWNAVPVARFVENLSWSTCGANPFARIALALRSLTVRPLGFMPAPDEDWVTLSFIGPRAPGTVTVPWRVYFPEAAGGTASMTSPTAGGSTLDGVDRSTLAVNGGWFDLYSRPPGPAMTPRMQRWAQSVSARVVRTTTGEWGYVRIFSFEATDSGAFIDDIAELLRTLPPDGLILDLRANPGGVIPSGEALARLFSTREVRTEPVSFRNTPQVRPIGDHPEFRPWRRSLNMSVETGDVFSQGFSLTPETLGERGVYSGPVVLIVDALCYSTTDFLVATMQDNGVASIIGVDPVTGAGGANVWNQSVLREILASVGSASIGDLPRDMDISVPMRRSVRVGANAGLPVEGLGVFAHHPYALTTRDVLGSNEELIEFAGTVLNGLRHA
jgi:hypothetical protein